MSCIFSNMETWTPSQFRVSAAIDHQPSALSSARGLQQERAPKGRDPFQVGKGGHRDSGEQVLTRVLQPVVCNPQKEWEASLGHRPVIIESPPKEGEVSYGNSRKSVPLHSEGGLGDLVRFDGRISACSNPPIVKEVSSFLLSGRSVSVSGPTLRVVSEPKSLHPCGGCDDGPCSISGFTGSPLSRRLAPQEPAAGPPQDSNPGLSSLDYSSGLDTQPGEVRVIPSSRLVFNGTHYQTDLGLMFPPAVRFREAASRACRILLAKYATARDFLSLLGRLVSMSDLVPLGCLRYQPLQLYLLAQWRPSQGQLTCRILNNAILM